MLEFYTTVALSLLAHLLSELNGYFPGLSSQTISLSGKVKGERWSSLLEWGTSVQHSFVGMERPSFPMITTVAVIKMLFEN